MGRCLLALALGLTACAPGRNGSALRDADDARRLTEAVERLRVERRLRDRKIRELENRLAERTLAAEPAASDEPSLPVQVQAPPTTEPGVSDVADAADASSTSDRRDDGASASAPGERVIGIADDGSEIVYVDDAATGRVVQPSAEILASVGRSPRRAAAPLGGPAIDDSGGRELLDGEAHDRIEPLDSSERVEPAPLSRLGRRAARVRTSRHPLPAPVPAVSLPAAAAAAPQPPAAAQPPTRGTGAGAAEIHYRAAMALIRAASYPEAITSLREFLHRYPSHDYADNAQYWLGEAFYAQRQYDKALVELRRVGELYPGGNKVPDALLKVGYCHLAMGDRETSVTVLRELLRLFPKSEPAVLAARKLEEVSR